MWKEIVKNYFRVDEIKLNPRLKKIKRLILDGQVMFTLKAELELDNDLDKRDVYEAILNADEIYKVINSTNSYTGKKEKLYVIKGLTYDNILIYTKGKIFNNKLYILRGRYER
ncbi:MAG TPA: hypothetical protein VJL89_11490 [Thermodesulfovibrionia bacterium]|nr:hypothetical protein [Thermodesulfovibrionia bacterium]